MYRGGAGITAGYSNNGLGIRGEQIGTSNNTQTNIFITVFAEQITGPGRYSFKKNGANDGNGSYLNTTETGPKGEAPYYYYSNDNLPGLLTVTKFDPVNKIIEGTFEFDAANQFYPNLIVHITEGKFGIQYQ